MPRNKNKKRKQRARPKATPKQSKNRANKHLGKLLKLIGSTVGGKIAGPIGSFVGSSAGELFSKISGMGEYKIHANTLLNQQAPKFGSSTSIRVKHSEFVTDVTTSKTAGEFDLRQYQLCPSNLSTFPWLQRIAKNYEEYKFHGLIFFYKPTSGTAVGSTNTALGTVIMATQYDVTADPFTDKKQMEAYEFSCSCVPCDDMLHPVECDPRDNPLDVMYTRSGALQTDSQDRRFHDLGNFNIATVGGQAADVTLGELWVSYDVEFLKPRLPSSGDGLWKAYVTMATNGVMSSPYVADNSDLNVRFDDSTTPTSVTIEDPGYYLAIAWVSSATTGLALQSGWALGDNTSSLPDSDFFNTNATNIFRIEDQTSPDRASYSLVFEVNTTGNGVVNLPIYTLGDQCVVDLVIVRLPSVGPSYSPGPSVDLLKSKRIPPGLERHFNKMKLIDWPDSKPRGPPWVDVKR